MRAEVRRRLAQAERAIESKQGSWPSDAELLKAIKSRKLTRRLLEALYQRIRDPFTASVLVSAWQLRWGRELELAEPAPGFPLETLALTLSYPSDNKLPHRLAGDRYTDGSYELPDAKGRAITWSLDVNSWLVRFLTDEWGGIDAMRTAVDRLYTEKRILDDIPVYSDEQAARVMAYVEFVPSNLPLHKIDSDLLLWVDKEGRWCTSGDPDMYRARIRAEKVVNGGQKWTRGGLISDLHEAWESGEEAVVSQG